MQTRQIKRSEEINSRSKEIADKFLKTLDGEKARLDQRKGQLKRLALTLAKAESKAMTKNVSNEADIYLINAQITHTLSVNATLILKGPLWDAMSILDKLKHANNEMTFTISAT